MEPGDLEIIAADTPDYLGFSYYMSNAVRACVAQESDGLSGGNEHTVESPYVEVPSCPPNRQLFVKLAVRSATERQQGGFLAVFRQIAHELAPNSSDNRQLL